MKKRININELLWLIVLMFLSFYFYRLIETGEVLFFIHPKMIKFVELGAIALMVLALSQVFNIFSRRRKRIKIGYALFFAIIFFAIWTKPEMLNAEIVGNKIIDIHSINRELSIHHLEENHEGHNHEEHFDDNYLKDTSIYANTELQNNNNKRDDLLIIDEKNFMESIGNLYYSLDKYLGKEVEITGFTLSKESKSGEFILGRIIISCCAADSQIVGFVCESKESYNLQSGKWIKVTGVIKGQKNVKNGESVMEPIISIENIEEVQEPKDKYIYH